LNSASYKGFAITPRTFQIRGSGRWTLDLAITHHGNSRTFTGPATFASERAAINGCHEFGRRIIDGHVQSYPVDRLPR
jgi:hypothetical protein